MEKKYTGFQCQRIKVRGVSGRGSNRKINQRRKKMQLQGNINSFNRDSNWDKETKKKSKKVNEK